MCLPITYKMQAMLHYPHLTLQSSDAHEDFNTANYNTSARNISNFSYTSLFAFNNYLYAAFGERAHFVQKKECLLTKSKSLHLSAHSSINYWNF